MFSNFPLMSDLMSEPANLEPPSTNTIQNIQENILLSSRCILPENPITIKGYDFNNGLNWTHLMESYKSMGFQASLFYEACSTVNEMVCK